MDRREYGVPAMRAKKKGRKEEGRERMLEVGGGRKERKRGTREERKGGSKERKRKGKTDKGENQGKVLGKVSGGALKELALSGAPAF